MWCRRSRRMMIELVRSSVAGQYGAALAMLHDCVERAGPTVWPATVGTRPYWHVAYHTLFVTDLYLSPSEETFRPQPFHREDSDELGGPPRAAGKKVTAGGAFDPAAPRRVFANGPAHAPGAGAGRARNGRV